MTTPVSAPTSYATWNATDGTFRIQYPDGWIAKGGGRRGVQWARFESGPATIRVDVGIVGSLLADIARSGGGVGGIGGVGGVEVDPDTTPVAMVHQDRIVVVAEDFSGYSEEPAETVDSKLGDVRRGQFTARESFGGTMRGYHATALSRDRRITILCWCPESNWETLRPAFATVIESVARGTR